MELVHVFMLVLTIGDQPPPGPPMHFYSITRCNWFAAQISKRYANANYYYYRDIPEDKRAIAYCVPKMVQLGSGNPSVIYE